MTRRMPDGVLDPDYAAQAVSADLKSAKTAARSAERRTPKYVPAGISGAPKPSREDRARATLLAAVRRGNPAAVRTLREVHHAWIIPGPKEENT